MVEDVKIPGPAMEYSSTMARRGTLERNLRHPSAPANHLSRLKNPRIVFAGLLALLTHIISAPAFGGPFLPGEILVNDVDGANIQRYGADGTLLQTYTGTGAEWIGAALTPDGNLVTSYRMPSANVDIFSPSGSLLTTFSAGAGQTNDISIFSNGTLAVNFLRSNTVQFFSQSGTLLKSVTLPGADNPSYSVIGADDVLYVNSYDWLSPSIPPTVYKVSSSGVVLGSFTLTSPAGDMAISPIDGTLWIGDWGNGNLYHYATDGTQIGTAISTGLNGGLDGLAFAPDGLSLYATLPDDHSIHQLSLTGESLGEIPIPGVGTPGALVVVPTPEPTATLLLAGGGLAMLLKRRRPVQGG